MPTRVCFNNTTQNQQLSHQIIVRHETVIGLILYEVHKLNLAKYQEQSTRSSKSGGSEN